MPVVLQASCLRFLNTCGRSRAFLTRGAVARARIAGADDGELRSHWGRWESWSGAPTCGHVVGNRRGAVRPGSCGGARCDAGACARAVDSSAPSGVRCRKRGRRSAPAPGRHGRLRRSVPRGCLRHRRCAKRRPDDDRPRSSGTCSYPRDRDCRASAFRSRFSALQPFDRSSGSSARAMAVGEATWGRASKMGHATLSRTCRAV
jgi:hypothetical protein